MRGLSYRCKVGIVLDDQTISSVYCHQGGEPEIVGILLRDHYNKEETLKLLDMGDMSFLGKNIEETNFYNRDRNLDKRECALRNFDTVDEFLKFGPVDYAYLFKDDQWFVVSAKDVDNYKIIDDFVTIDEALLVKPRYVKKEKIATPMW